MDEMSDAQQNVVNKRRELAVALGGDRDGKLDEYEWAVADEVLENLSLGLDLVEHGPMLSATLRSAADRLDVAVQRTQVSSDR